MRLESEAIQPLECALRALQSLRRVIDITEDTVSRDELLPRE